MDRETQAHSLSRFSPRRTGKGRVFGLPPFMDRKQMDGAICVAAILGKGTTFRNLSAADAVAGTVWKKKRQPRQKSFDPFCIAGRTETVFGGDQKEYAICSGILERKGYTVRAPWMATTPTMRRVQRQIHLLVTDVVMPNICGQEVAAGYSSASAMKVCHVGLSGHASQVTELSTERPSALKPFLLDTLAHTLRDVLGDHVQLNTSWLASDSSLLR